MIVLRRFIINFYVETTKEKLNFHYNLKKTLHRFTKFARNSTQCANNYTLNVTKRQDKQIQYVLLVQLSAVNSDACIYV